MSGLLGAGDGERVPRSVVVRHWLRTECEAAAVGRRAGPVVEAGADAVLPAPERVGSLSESEALDLLLRAKPGVASFLVRDEPVAWYRTAVDGDRFRRLRLVESPPGTLWRALAPDRSPVTAARTVADRDPEALAAESGVDVRRVLRIRSTLDDGTGPASPLVVRTRRGRAPWTIVDGNHRAVARAMELVDAGGVEARQVDGGERHRDDGFAPQPVYVGVRPNPVVQPLRERVGGLVRRLFGREPGPP